MDYISPDYLTPSICERSIVRRVAQGPFRYQGWPSVCRASDGTLYAAASSFRLGHVCPFGKSALFTSPDNGKTWSIPRIVNDTWLDDRDTGLIFTAQGNLLLTWFEHPTVSYETWLRSQNNSLINAMLDSWKEIPADYPQGGSYLRLSADGGDTWGEQITVPVSAPHGPICGKNGVLYYLGKEMNPVSMLPDSKVPSRTALYVSEDGGKHWVLRSYAPIPEGLAWVNLDEPHIVQLPDSSLLGMLRMERMPGCPTFTMYQMRSEDDGYTWSVPQPTGVLGSPPHLLVHSSGAVICSYARRQTPFGQFAMVSRDGGKTWPVHYAIDDRAADGDLGYPCSVELADGSILTVYYQKCEGDDFPSILCTHWAL